MTEKPTYEELAKVLEDLVRNTSPLGRYKYCDVRHPSDALLHKARAMVRNIQEQVNG